MQTTDAVTIWSLCLLVGLGAAPGCSSGPGNSSESDTTTVGVDANGATDSSEPDTASMDPPDARPEDTGDTTRAGGTDTANGSSTDADSGRPDCQTLCDRVYDQCGLFLQYSNADKIPKSGCVNACEWGYFIGERRCIMQRECSKETLNDCITLNPASPDLAALDPEDNWPESWKKYDRQVFALVNLHRRRGVSCGDTDYPPTDPLEWNDEVAEAARAHSLDMAKNDFYAHRGSDGSTPGERIARTDYGAARASGEAINRTFSNPFAAVRSWLNSASHCRRMVSPDHPYVHVGSGYVHAPSNENTHLWTLDYAAR